MAQRRRRRRQQRVVRQALAPPSRVALAPRQVPLLCATAQQSNPLRAVRQDLALSSRGASVPRRRTPLHVVAPQKLPPRAALPSCGKPAPRHGKLPSVLRSKISRCLLKAIMFPPRVLGQRRLLAREPHKRRLRPFEPDECDPLSSCSLQAAFSQPHSAFASARFAVWPPIP